jgi:hypothetical protein
MTWRGVSATKHLKPLEPTLDVVPLERKAAVHTKATFPATCIPAPNIASVRQGGFS